MNIGKGGKENEKQVLLLSGNSGAHRPAGNDFIPAPKMAEDSPGQAERTGCFHSYRLLSASISGKIKTPAFQPGGRSEGLTTNRPETF